jgi:hypothetical protein
MAKSKGKLVQGTGVGAQSTSHKNDMAAKRRTQKVLRRQGKAEARERY